MSANKNEIAFFVFILVTLALSVSPPAESDAVTVLDHPAVQDTTGTMDADLEVVVDTFEVVDATVAVLNDVGISTMTYAVLMAVFDGKEYKMVDSSSTLAEVVLLGQIRDVKVFFVSTNASNEKQSDSRNQQNCPHNF